MDTPHFGCGGCSNTPDRPCSHQTNAQSDTFVIFSIPPAVLSFSAHRIMDLALLDGLRPYPDLSASSKRRIPK